MGSCAPKSNSGTLDAHLGGGVLFPRFSTTLWTTGSPYHPVANLVIHYIAPPGSESLLLPQGNLKLTNFGFQRPVLPCPLELRGANFHNQQELKSLQRLTSSAFESEPALGLLSRAHSLLGPYPVRSHAVNASSLHLLSRSGRKLTCSIALLQVAKGVPAPYTGINAID